MAVPSCDRNGNIPLAGDAPIVFWFDGCLVVALFFTRFGEVLLPLVSFQGRALGLLQIHGIETITSFNFFPKFILIKHNYILY